MTIAIVLQPVNSGARQRKDAGPAQNAAKRFSEGYAFLVSLLSVALAILTTRKRREKK
ncbi:hypothetical protein RY831_01970 [Noviherbaspirillum sp. CPCC 100848]|uniref:Uncharacterized protein n=1 Tax=Noviherbaspirillum album TaxID=3080276 RepID=A0ABU6J3A2_9BURK|nr:hypothetical protein [Noviherbaspirillum sp. CPCC 100848]MEC4717906.1 hypothetical protein [Noviherbaspirillum sp. CPCC 100848]